MYLLSQLQGVSPSEAGTWKAQCPAHNDPTASLNIKADKDTILVHCFGGCQTSAVLKALGMTFKQLFGREDTVASQAQRPPEVRPDYEFRSKVYAQLLAQLTLDYNDKHALWEFRKLADDDTKAGGFKTLNYENREDLAAWLAANLGEKFSTIPGLDYRNDKPMLKVPNGILIPIFGIKGDIRAIQCRRYDENGPKYVTLSGGPGGTSGSPVHVPVRSVNAVLNGEPLIITEGPLKAHVISHKHSPAIGMIGVSWRAALGLLHRYPNRHIGLALDMDKHQKPGVLAAEEDFVVALKREGHTVSVMEWDPRYKGLDDLLVSQYPKYDLTGLVQNKEQ